MVASADILGAKILIVDDLEANVVLLGQMLRDAGYGSIATTMDPSEVCERHSRNQYDLILLDLEMPVMDGFMVMEGLKELELEDYLSVLVVTAQSGHKLRALQAGAKDFVSKPFELPEVLARVHNLLEVRLLHTEAKNQGKALELQNAELQSALENVKLLSGLLPICAWCKKIRDDQGYWDAIEHYISQHSEAEFTHGICPECMGQFSGEMLDDKP